MQISTLSRWNINKICDSVPKCTSLDMGISSSVATYMIQYNIRKQLTGKKMKATDAGIQKLADFIIMSELRAKVVDDTYVGLWAPEALVLFLSQLTLDAFKAIGEEKEAANVINILQGIWQTTINHSRPYTTVHFNLDYSSVPGYSFTYREAYDTRAHFVYTSLKEYLLKDGYIFGVMAEYSGDAVPPNIRELRNYVVDRYATTLISPGRWTHFYNACTAKSSTKSISATSTCVHMVRLKFDKQIMYKQGITMEILIGILKTCLSGKSITPTIIASGFTEAIIDIYPTGIITDPENLKDTEVGYSELNKERVLLYSSIRNNLEEIRVSGIPYKVPSKNSSPRVLALKVKTVKYSILYTLLKVSTESVENLKTLSTTIIEELGRQIWLEELELPANTDWKVI